MSTYRPLISAKSSLFCRRAKERAYSRPRSMANMPNALISAATRGTITIGMDNCLAMEAAWMPPAPPPPTTWKYHAPRPLLVRAFPLQLHISAQEVVGRDITERQVRVGHRGLVALAIRGRSGVRPGALRPHPQQAQGA